VPGGEIGQFANKPVTKFLEVWRLETECVEGNVLHAAPARFLFSHVHQALTVPLAAQLFLDPHQAEIEPADNFLIGGA
jgi:hypothetical protein